MLDWQKSGHEYRLWRAYDVLKWLPILKETKLYTEHPALQSDLLRLLILKEHGGLYVDCDCELVNDIPHDLPVNLAGWYITGADPFLLHVEPNCKSINTMLQFGALRTNGLHEIYRWGFKAYNKVWPGLVADVSDWCIHRGEQSWLPKTNV